MYYGTMYLIRLLKKQGDSGSMSNNMLRKPLGFWGYTAYYLTLVHYNQIIMFKIKDFSKKKAKSSSTIVYTCIFDDRKYKIVNNRGVYAASIYGLSMNQEFHKTVFRSYAKDIDHSIELINKYD